MTGHILAEAATPESTLLTQIAVLITAVGGVIIGLRTSRRDGSSKELADIREKLVDLQDDLITVKSWIFAQRSTLADQGVQLPTLPPLNSDRWRDDP